MFKIISLLIVVVVIMFSTIYALKSFTTTTGAKGPVSTIESTKKVACSSNIQQLNQFIKQFKILHDGEAITLENLKKAGLMLPKCEAGGEYIIEDGKFICTVHTKKQ
jgi:hypothetical protein